MNQLSRIIVGGSSGTPDEQGGYGGLMDEIDRLLAQTSADERERPES